MQKLQQFFLTKFAILLLALLQSFNCQADNQSLVEADSLFKSKNYQEAQVLYESILNQDHSYSPAMLLKMAFISEGMGDFSKTILYLSKYYDHHPNPQIPNKIKELTNQTSQNDYSVTDWQQSLGLLSENNQMIISILTILLILALIAQVMEGFQTRYFVTGSVLIGLVSLSNSSLEQPQTGIVSGNPSASKFQP